MIIKNLATLWHQILLRNLPILNPNPRNPHIRMLPQCLIPIPNDHRPQIRLPGPPQHLRKVRIVRDQEQPVNPSAHGMLHLPLQSPIRGLGFILHGLDKNPSTPKLRGQAVPDLGRDQGPGRLVVLVVPGYVALLETLPFLALERPHPVQLLLALALVELLEVLLQVQIGLTLAAADPADVRLGWGRDEALALEDVELFTVAALLEDPLGQVDEGVAVGVGGGVDHVAEALGDPLERHGGLVGGATRGLVVEVPEDDYLLLLWGVDALLGLDHVDLGGGGAGSDGDGPFEAKSGSRRGFGFEG
ncbi:hypothetical protein TorRG33x02_099710 [Trema orientale]|uniref:Uncharacterized protein n=1 Tax=Trema orientale TaxID=63057 RepID=A0A2P5F8W8_TREOI|nr:hypothetical protein TorRG33x02_099710 [Trema orientale]